MQEIDPATAAESRKSVRQLCETSLYLLHTYLEVDDHQEDGDGGEEVGDIGKILPVECLLQSPHLHMQMQLEIAAVSSCYCPQ